MKKFLFFLVALTIILPVKAQVDIDDLEDSKFRIIIPRHNWTTHLSPIGGIMVENANGKKADAGIFNQAAVSNDRFFTAMASDNENNYPNKTSEGYMYSEPNAQPNQGWWNAGNSPSTFTVGSGDWYFMGPAIAADDAGTIWTSVRQNSYGVISSTLEYGWAHPVGSVAYYTQDNLPAMNSTSSAVGVPFRTVNTTQSESGLYQSTLDGLYVALTGKTVRRTILNGNYIYALALGSNNAPTLLVYNISTNSVIATVSTEGCEGSSLALSDIQLTEDGYLVGCAENMNEYASTSTYCKIYKWENDANGLPTGDPIKWVETSGSGYMNPGLVGSTFAYTGTTTEGKIVLSAIRQTASDIGVYCQVITISGGVKTDDDSTKPWYEYPTGYKDWAIIDNKHCPELDSFLGNSFHYVSSPFNTNTDNDSYIVVSSGDAPIYESHFYHAEKTTELSKVSTDIVAAKVPNVSFFKKGDQTLMVYPDVDATGNVLGIKIADVSNGFASASNVTLNNSTLSSPISTYSYASAHGKLDSNGQLELYLVVDNSIYKFTEADPNTGYTYHAISSRCDFMSAYGDGVNGVGYLWFTPRDCNFAERVEINKGVFNGITKFNLPEGELNYTRSSIIQFTENQVLYHRAGQNKIGDIFIGTINGTSIDWENTGLKYFRNGATAFVLHGHVVIAYSHIPDNIPETPTYDDKSTYISLYDWTYDSYIGKFSPFELGGESSWLNHAIQVTKVTSGKQRETDFFSYAPGRGGMKSIARAIVSDNPVINLQVEHYCHKMSDEVSVDEGHRKVRLTWEAQTYDRDIFNNYEIRYRTTRSDGSTVVTDWTKIDETVSIDYSDGNYEENRSASFVYELTYGGADTPNDLSDDYDLMYEFSVIPVYSYDTNDRHHQNTEYTVEALTPTIPSAAPRTPIDATLSQITEEEDDVTRYSFDLKLDVTTNGNLEIPYLIGGGKPSIDTYVVEITGENASEIATELGARDIVLLDENGNDITDEVTLTKYPAGTTISAYNCDHYDITNYCFVVKSPNASSTAGTKMPTLVWKNANPQLPYQVKVYGISNYECNFIAASPDKVEMTIPMPSWSLTPVDFHKLNGDFSSLTGNEDMPMGSFRRIDPATNKLDENPSNPVTLSAANYFGTQDAMLTPIYVTDGVLGVYNTTLNTYENNAWIIDYTLFVYDANKKQIKRAEFETQNNVNGYAPCYSNTQNVRCDILGLEVPYDATTNGEDGRNRKVYKPGAASYSTKILVEFKRKSDNFSFFKEATAPLSSRTVQLPELGIENYSGGSVDGALYQRKEPHFYYDNAQSNGYYPYYYDAAVLFDWGQEDALNRYMGYYGASKIKCYGHYEGNNRDTWVQYHSGSVLSDSEIDFMNNSNEALKDGKIGYGTTVDGVTQTNWTDLAITKGQIPLLIHNVYSADKPLTDASTVNFDVTLTAEYPVIVSGSQISPTYPDEENLCEVIADQDPSTYVIVNSNRYMDVMTVPTALTNMTVANTKITTGVEGILTEACGGVKLYPNPVISSFTLEAPMIINEVKIFAPDGQLVKVVKDINETKAVINVDELPQGVYLVNTLGTVKTIIRR